MQVKRLLITVLAAILTLPVLSQQFTDQQNQWNVANSNGWTVISTEIYRYSGDTLILGNNYRKMVYQPDSSVSTDWYYIAAIREENGYVYGVFNRTEEECLLYNFNLLPGESAYIQSIWCTGPTQVTCIDTASVEINGTSRRVIFLDDTFEERWTEGIGSHFGPLYASLYMCVTDIYHHLLCYYNDNQLLYMDPDAISCYETNVSAQQETLNHQIKLWPNPAALELHVELPDMGSGYGGIYEAVNSAGKVILSGTTVNTPHLYINLASFPEGIYLFRWQTRKSNITSKFIICR